MENLGRLEEKRRRAIELAVLMHQLRLDINHATNPNRPLRETNFAALQVMLANMEQASVEHLSLTGEIKALCADLGEPMPNVDPGRG
jgi:hypothetical protein